MATLNKAGEAHLRSLIGAGNYNTDQDWSFTADDGNALLGSSGDDWTRYGNVHLGIEPDEDPKTKAHWKYPAAHAKGDSEEVFRKGLIAAKQRAAANKDRDVEAAAARLIDQIDEKEGKGKKGATSDATAAAAAAPTTYAAVISSAMRDLPRVASRIIGTPLMVAPNKLEMVMGVLGPRINLASVATAAAKILPLLVAPVPKAMEDGDNGGDNSGGAGYSYDMTADGVALIDISGNLVHKSGFVGALCGLTSYGSIGAVFAQAVANPDVKGVLLTVDSYGGECNGFFDLADAIFAARSQKPIFAAIDDNAFSAAYGLASSADKIFVSRTGGVGSVGVVALHVDRSKADEAEGMKYEYVYAGAKKIEFNEHAPLSGDARSALQNEIDRSYLMFVTMVARNRGLDIQAVMDTQAGLFFGDNAIAARFADALGTPTDALAALRSEIGRRADAAAAMTTIATAQPADDPNPDGGERQPDAPQNPGTGAASVAPISGDTNASIPKIEGSNVVDLAKVRGEGAAAAAETHLEIIDLCTLAGHLDLATTAIREKLTVEQVRHRITDARAKASATRSTSAHIMPDAGINPNQAASANWDQAFARARGVQSKEK